VRAFFFGLDRRVEVGGVLGGGELSFIKKRQLQFLDKTSHWKP
jgi:hypothetical protein